MDDAPQPAPRSTTSAAWMLRTVAVSLLVASPTTARADDPPVPVPPPVLAAETYAGHALVQLQATPAEAEALGLDVWTHRTDVASVLVRVTPGQWALLYASGLEFVVVEPDLGPAVEQEQARLALTALTGPPVQGGVLDPTFHDDFRELDAVLARLDALALVAPTRVTMVEIGVSLEGRPIRGVRITNPGAADRPVVLVQSCQHAREWISVAANLYAAEQLAFAEADSLLDGLLYDAEIIMVPVVNPDGYVFSWEAERLWRKNRRPEFGVDLNRNWAVAWGGPGSGEDPQSGNYRGSAPFSEPEASAVRDFMEAEPDLVAFFDVHSYGQLMLYPWGYGYEEAPDAMQYADLATTMSDTMWLVHNTWYQPMQSSDLYPAAGNAIDWGYGALGLWSVTVELRPDDEEPGFLLPPEQIVPTGEELLVGIASLVAQTVALGPAAPGDSGDPQPGIDTGDPPEPPPPPDDTTGGGVTTDEPPGNATVVDDWPDTDGGAATSELPGGTGSGTAASGFEDDPSVPRGCACRADRPVSPSWQAWCLPVLVMASARRRRRR